jgi:hypothetical protein
MNACSYVCVCKYEFMRIGLCMQSANILLNPSWNMNKLRTSTLQCRPVFPADVDSCDGAQQEEAPYDDSHETRCPTGAFVDSFSERNTNILVSKCGFSLAYKD